MFIGQSYFNNDGAQIKYFNQFTKLLQPFLVLMTQSQNGNLRNCQMENLRVFCSKCKCLTKTYMDE